VIFEVLRNLEKLVKDNVKIKIIKKIVKMKWDEDDIWREKNKIFQTAENKWHDVKNIEWNKKRVWCTERKK